MIHGLGFAGALSEVGLPQTAIPVALLFFNVGVEIGQLLFVSGVMALLAVGRKSVQRIGPPAVNFQESAFARLAPSYAIGALAMFWVLQRIAGF